MFEALRDRFALAASTDALLDAYRMRVLELIEPLPGAVETLNALRESGCRLAIVTNGSASQQHAKIDALGLRSMVDVVCVSAEVGYRKPDPRMFRQAAELTGCSITDAWMVGDSATNDVVGAAVAGARTVGSARPLLAGFRTKP